MSGTGAILVLLMVLLALFLHAARIINITWGFSLAKNGPHDINVGGVRQLVPFLEKSLDVVLQTLLALMDTLFEVLRASRTFLHALEIAHESLLKVDPIVDGVARQMLEPHPCPFHEVDGQELDD